MAVGFSVGFVVGWVVAETLIRPALRKPTAFERVGKSVVDAFGGIVPESFTKRFVA